jgi:ankyrin repeat protein
MSLTPSPTQETIDQFVGNAHGNLVIVKDLLERFPSMINANASWTETAIEAAAQKGQVEIVKYLLEYGADPNPRYEGKTSLAIAQEKKQAELVEGLRSAGGAE